MEMIEESSIPVQGQTRYLVLDMGHGTWFRVDGFRSPKDNAEETLIGPAYSPYQVLLLSDAEPVGAEEKEASGLG